MTGLPPRQPVRRWAAAPTRRGDRTPHSADFDARTFVHDAVVRCSVQSPQGVPIGVASTGPDLKKAFPERIGAPATDTHSTLPP